MLAISQPLQFAPPPVSLSDTRIATGASANSFLCENSNEDYHGDKSHLSSSTIKEMLRSPAHCKAYMSGKKRKETNAMQIGTALHMAVLEPHLFGSSYAIWDDIRKGKMYDEFLVQNKGKTVLRGEEMDKVLGMANAVRSYSEYPIRKAIDIGHSELSIYWTDPETGIGLKIRPDSFSEYATLDVKKTQDARPEKFVWTCRDYGYDVQAALYMTGMEHFLGKKVPFYFVAVEEESPHGVWVHEVSKEMYESGMAKLRKALNLYKQCTETNNWPAYQNAFSVIRWPDYLSAA